MLRDEPALQVQDGSPYPEAVANDIAMSPEDSPIIAPGSQLVLQRSKSRVASPVVAWSREIYQHGPRAGDEPKALAQSLHLEVGLITVARRAQVLVVPDSI